MRAHEFLLEGGWSDVSTQGTTITPQLVAAVMPAVEQFRQKFNEFLRQRQLPEVSAVQAAGSAYYYKTDLVAHPDKVYGDIDVHFFIPRIESMYSGTNSKMYSDLVREFCETETEYKTDNGNAVIFHLGKDYVQVDLIKVFADRADWVPAVVPEHGLKGVVSTSVYSSLAELLNLSIGSEGVLGKIRDGHLVSFRMGRVDRVITISTDPKNWAVDIFRYFARGKRTAKMTPELAAHPGIQPGNLQVADIVAAVLALGQALEANGLFGHAELSGIANYQDYITKITKIFSAKMHKAITGSKFDKAVSAEARQKAEKDKAKIAHGRDRVLAMLSANQNNS